MIVIIYRKEQEVQMMMNRIALLESEKVRMSKRVQLTQKKAAEIYVNKVLNEQKIRDKMRS